MRASSLSPPIIAYQFRYGLSHCVSLCSSQIGFLVLRKCGKQENRDIDSAEEVDDPRATTFAATAETDSHFADTAAAWNDHAAMRIGRNQTDDSLPLIFAKQSLGPGKAAFRPPSALFGHTTALP
jgi:hypothetical protein